MTKRLSGTIGLYSKQPTSKKPLKNGIVKECDELDSSGPKIKEMVGKRRVFVEYVMHCFLSATAFVLTLDVPLSHSIQVSCICGLLIKFKHL